jgi:hypothetical protein
MMNSATTGAVVFACLTGAALLGMRVRAVLPEHHVNPQAKDAVKFGMGLVATMAALVLGLLVASTKGAYDTKKSEVTQMAAKIAPRNATVIVALMLAALSVAGAIFLILELDMPFDGIIQISPGPMRNALIHLGH